MLCWVNFNYFSFFFFIHNNVLQNILILTQKCMILLIYLLKLEHSYSVSCKENGQMLLEEANERTLDP